MKIMNKNKLFDKMVLIDLEATCEENNVKISWQSEIIEVGVCLLDLKTLEISNPMGILIKPISSPITEFCTKLTTITQNLLNEQGITLNEAMILLEKEYKISKRTWASWGDYDKKMLLKDCAAKQLNFPGENRSHQNIKNILAIQLGWDKETSLEEGLKRFNLDFNGTQHRGIDDALNIAELYANYLKLIRTK